MKRQIYRTAFSVVLAILMCTSLIPVSFARSSYSADQYYTYSSYNTKVYTVQFSAGKNLGGAEKNRDSMLTYGKDAFVYCAGEWYRVMTGKFRNYDDAKTYLKSIQKIKGADDGYITSAYLPEYSITEFEDIYFGCNSWQNNRPSWSGKDPFWSDTTPSWPWQKPSWCSPVEDWYIYVPKGFQRCENTGDTVSYYSSKYDMYFSITPEIIAATSAKSRNSILSNEYKSKLRAYPRATYQELSDDHYDISGYDRRFIYYYRGIVTSDTFYTLYFYYPSSNRRYCDSTLETIRDSFRG